MLEMSARQSLALSGGSYAIFVQRPIAAALLALAAALVLLSLRRRTADPRGQLIKGEAA
jgi:TctA family transporter